jgi:Uma2 family endonuclease
LTQQQRGLQEIVINDRLRIPGWVRDLESFRRWATSDDYPRRGWFAYLHGNLWVDPSMEQLFTHNQVKGEYAYRVMAINEKQSMGRYFHDRTLLTNVLADLSTEPDGLFATWDTLQTGRLRSIAGASEGYVELEGTPAMVLEVVSTSSVRKDTEILLELYWRAGIQEYWLVDARGATLHFQILRHAAKSYVPVKPRGGWLKSAVFGRSFRLTQQTDPLGHPLYTLAFKP